MTLPYYTQTHWRFREDGGTYLGTGNDDDSITLDLDTTYRIRFEVVESNNKAANNQNFRLQYQLNTGGWNDVTTTSSVVQAVASDNITDAADTTQELTSTGGFITDNDGFAEDGYAGTTSTFSANGCAEYEFSFQILSADVANEDVLDLRLELNDTTVLDDWTNYPSLTISEGKRS